MDIYTEYLNILELTEEASLENIKESYRELVQIWHPDKCGNNENLKKRATEKLKIINEAYGYLIENYTNESAFIDECEFKGNGDELEKDGNFSQNKNSRQNYCTDFKIEYNNDFYLYNKNRLKYPKFEIHSWVKVFISTMVMTLLIIIIFKPLGF